MSTASRVIQTVRPHIPLIRFRKGQGTVEAKASDLIKSVAAQNAISSNPDKSMPKVGSTPRGSAVLEDIDLPAKYQRKLISEEEIAFIERGGPE